MAGKWLRKRLGDLGVMQGSLWRGLRGLLLRVDWVEKVVNMNGDEGEDLWERGREEGGEGDAGRES